MPKLRTVAASPAFCAPLCRACSLEARIMDGLYRTSLAFSAPGSVPLGPPVYTYSRHKVALAARSHAELVLGRVSIRLNSNDSIQSHIRTRNVSLSVTQPLGRIAPVMCDLQHEKYCSIICDLMQTKVNERFGFLIYLGNFFSTF